jgi:hypothetical protein
MDAFAAQKFKNECEGIGPRKKMMNLGTDGLGATFEGAEIRRDRSFGNHG